MAICRVVVLVAPVAAVGVDGVVAEDFAGVFVDHGDGVGVDEDGHRLACVGCADAEMVHAAGGAEADLAEAVDVIVADPVVRMFRFKLSGRPVVRA